MTKHTDITQNPIVFPTIPKGRAPQKVRGLFAAPAAAFRHDAALRCEAPLPRPCRTKEQGRGAASRRRAPAEQKKRSRIVRRAACPIPASDDAPLKRPRMSLPAGMAGIFIRSVSIAPTLRRRGIPQACARLRAENVVSLVRPAPRRLDSVFHYDIFCTNSADFSTSILAFYRFY